MISFISVFVKWRKENKTSVNFQSTNSWSWMIGMCSYIHERERAHALRTDKQLKWIVQQAINKHQMNISTAFCCFIVPFFYWFISHSTVSMMIDERCALLLLQVCSIFAQVMIESVHSRDGIKLPNIAQAIVCSNFSIPFKISHFDTQIVCDECVCMSNQTSDVSHIRLNVPYGIRINISRINK